MARRARRRIPGRREPHPSHYTDMERQAAEERKRDFIERERATKARYAASLEIPLPELWARNLAENGEPGEAQAYREAGGF